MTDAQLIAMMAATIYANAPRDAYMSDKLAVNNAVDIFLLAREATENIHEQET
jgi:hypothetical protein